MKLAVPALYVRSKGMLANFKSAALQIIKAIKCPSAA